MIFAGLEVLGVPDLLPPHPGRTPKIASNVRNSADVFVMKLQFIRMVMPCIPVGQALSLPGFDFAGLAETRQAEACPTEAGDFLNLARASAVPRKE